MAFLLSVPIRPLWGWTRQPVTLNPDSEFEAILVIWPEASELGGLRLPRPIPDSCQLGPEEEQPGGQGRSVRPGVGVRRGHGCCYSCDQFSPRSEGGPAAVLQVTHRGPSTMTAPVHVGGAGVPG